jgi:hypothetical protein
MVHSTSRSASCQANRIERTNEELFEELLGFLSKLQLDVEILRKK